MLGSRSLAVLVAALAASVPGVSARTLSLCDDLRVEITNQTEVARYKTCPVITGIQFFVMHEFKGPFEMSDVQSIPKFSSGYFGPKFKDSTRVDDGVTSISMPDLKNTSAGGMLFGYIDNLTSISFPKLERVAGDLAIIGNSADLRNLSLPVLSTTTGGILIDGPFNQIDLPALKSVRYMYVKSTGNISCPALGAAFASLKFTPQKLDAYAGFTCWTFDPKNRWNSSDPEHNPKPGDATSPTGSSPGSNPTSDTKPSAANIMNSSYQHLAFLMALSVFGYLI